MPHPACQRVPLIVSWPGVTDAAGSTVDEYVYQFDLMPTICELLNVPRPAKWDAEAFTPALRDEEFEGREFVMSGHGIYTFGRAVYRDDWLYVRLLHPGVFHHPGLFNDPDLPNDGLELLHDLSEDPHQTENLIGERPDVAAELRGTLDRWLVKHTSDEWNEQRPVEARGRDPLAKMASYGPYLYVDPDDLVDRYRAWTGRTSRSSRLSGASHSSPQRPRTSDKAPPRSENYLLAVREPRSSDRT